MSKQLEVKVFEVNNISVVENPPDEKAKIISISAKKKEYKRCPFCKSSRIAFFHEPHKWECRKCKARWDEKTDKILIVGSPMAYTVDDLKTQCHRCDVNVFFGDPLAITALKRKRGLPICTDCIAKHVQETSTQGLAG